MCKHSKKSTRPKDSDQSKERDLISLMPISLSASRRWSVLLDAKIEQIFYSANMGSIEKEKASPLREAYDYLRSIGAVHTQTNVAEKTGYNKSVVSQALSGIEGYVTRNFVSAFNEAFGGIFNEDYLLRGEGTLLKDAHADEAPQKPHKALHEVETIASGSRIIQTLPIIPIEAQAGIGKGFLYDVDPSQDPEDIYDEFDSMEVVLEREVSDRYKLFRVKGDSMTDGTLSSICTGDVLLCREVFPEDWKLGLTNNRYPNVVIVIEEEGILIKQLIKHSKKNETISLHSINPKYNDFTVDLKNVRAFYYVERIVDRHMSQW